MSRDYAELLPRVLKAMYPDGEERARVMHELAAYGVKSHHREQDRVRLGILRLTWQHRDRLQAYVHLACRDFRDLLCAAEYPLTASRWGLRRKDPNRYARLAAREQRDYDQWLTEVLSVTERNTADGQTGTT